MGSQIPSAIQAQKEEGTVCSVYVVKVVLSPSCGAPSTEGVDNSVSASPSSLPEIWGKIINVAAAIKELIAQSREKQGG